MNIGKVEATIHYSLQHRFYSS